MIRHALGLTALLALAAPLASAQGLAVFNSGDKDLQTLRVRGIPSQQESEYLSHLALSLGASSDTAVVQVPYSLSDLGPRGRSSPADLRTLTANGVAARVGGVDLQRLRFPSADHAQRFGIYAAQTQGTPTFVEVRGSQVVIARGERIADSQDLEKIREAAWEVLPHAPGAPSVAGVVFTRSEFAYESRIRNEHLEEFVDGAVLDARKHHSNTTTFADGRATVIREGHSSSVARLSPSHVTLWAVQGLNQGVVVSPRIQTLAESIARTSEALQRAAERTPAAQGGATAQNPASSSRTPAAPAQPLESKQGIGTIIRGIGDYSE